MVVRPILKTLRGPQRHQELRKVHKKGKNLLHLRIPVPACIWMLYPRVRMFIRWSKKKILQHAVNTLWRLLSDLENFWKCSRQPVPVLPFQIMVTHRVFVICVVFGRELCCNQETCLEWSHLHATNLPWIQHMGCLAITVLVLEPTELQEVFLLGLIQKTELKLVFWLKQNCLSTNTAGDEFAAHPRKLK